MTNAVNNLLSLFGQRRFHFNTESELQEGIASVLTDASFEFKREVTLSRKDRIDFLVGDVGIEVKVGGSLASVTRQLHRYSEFDKISSLILVTSRMCHGLNLPNSMNGKPLSIHAIVSL